MCSGIVGKCTQKKEKQVYDWNQVQCLMYVPMKKEAQ